MIDLALSLWLDWRMKIRQQSLSKHVRNIQGQKFGRLTVLTYAGIDSRGCSVWTCRCDCGTVGDYGGPTLTKGHTSSCGCLKQEKFLSRITKHGHSSPKNRSPEYTAWNNMLARCNRPNHPQYPDYGGRGIKVCERWAAFGNFLIDVGVRPSSKHSIHRIDNDLGYIEGNVKWATQPEQQNCKRTNHQISFNGETQNLVQWATETGINYIALHYRLKRGWSVDKALTTPLQKRHAN